MIEILAPCGGEDCLPAALNTGADAVYLGTTAFSARKNAKNFTPERIGEVVRLCHASGVKVHVTMNTLIFDDELNEAVRIAEQLYEAGVDALIVQDIGLAGRLRSAVPEMPLHASTQMTINSASGAEFARKMGFSRVVLAREMSYKEISEVVGNVDVETEVFVHGALCVCLSGQCLMSAMYGGRSGNRGLCAQPCRLDFSFGDRHNVLSLKDLSVISRLKKLDELGVTSAKIEGRMKRPEYVAAAVTACRKALAGEAPDMERLRAVFSRSGFTESYFDGSMQDMQGIRTKEDVAASADALKALQRLYDKPYKRFAADISVAVSTGKPVFVKASAGGAQVAYETEIVPETARSRESTSEEICGRLAKMGGTVFEAGKISCEIDGGLILSAANVNEIRREALEKLTVQIIKLNKRKEVF